MRRYEPVLQGRQPRRPVAGHYYIDCRGDGRHVIPRKQRDA